MFICVYDDSCGQGKTVAEAFDDLMGSYGTVDIEQCSFYLIDKEVEVELQVKQIKIPTITTPAKRK